MDMKTREYLKQFQQERNITSRTLESYKSSILQYERINQATITELLQEADHEEEQGIRWKHRRLRKRLIKYQNHLLNQYNYSTTRLYLSRVKTIYKHNLIEIHELPPLNRKQARISTPITYDDLPDKETLRRAYNISTPLLRAYILFAISTGCAKREILNLTRKDYQDWISGHDPNKEEIVPTIMLKRQKTNKHYSTFATPEAIREISHYLETRDDDDPELFRVHPKYLEVQFRQLNKRLGLGTLNGKAKLRTHTLRKFHASQLYNAENGLTLDEIDSLQGRSKEITHQSYYFDNTDELKKKYIQNIDQVTILDEVHTLTVDSPEVAMLKEKAEKIDELEKLVKKIMERNRKEEF